MREPLNSKHTKHFALIHTSEVPKLTSRCNYTTAYINIITLFTEHHHISPSLYSETCVPGAVIQVVEFPEFDSNLTELLKQTIHWHQNRKRNEQRTLVDQSKWALYTDTAFIPIIRKNRIPVNNIWHPDVDRLRKTLNSYLQTTFNQVLVTWFQDKPGSEPHKPHLSDHSQALLNLEVQRNVTVTSSGCDYDALIPPGFCVCVHPSSKVYTSTKIEANSKEGVLLSFNQI